MRILLGIIYTAAESVLQKFVMREIQNDDTVGHCEIFIAKPSLVIITYYILLQRAGVSRAYILHILISE